MQLQQVNRTDAEKVFINILNVEASSITTGYGARFVGGAAAEIVSTDGISAVMTVGGGATMPQFAGIAAQDIAANSYGRVQSRGYVNSIAFSGVGTQLTVGVTGIAASFLIPGAAAGTFFSAGTPQAVLSTGMGHYVQAWTTTLISAHPSFGSGNVVGF